MPGETQASSAPDSDRLADETGLTRQAVQHVNWLLPGLDLVNAIADVDRDARHNSG